MTWLLGWLFKLMFGMMLKLMWWAFLVAVVVLLFRAFKNRTRKSGW